MPPPDHRPLQELRNQVARLEAVHCGLGHERVLRSAASSRPLLNPATEHGLLRNNLCDRSVRDGRISCTHTGARYVLIEALDALEKNAGVDAPRLRQRLLDLDGDLGVIDHRKGDAELLHARISEALEIEPAPRRHALEAERDTADSEIAQLEAAHGNAVDALEALRVEIIAQLDCAIAEGRAGR